MSGPESKPVEERKEGKNKISRGRESIDSVYPRESPSRVCVSLGVSLALCRCVQMRRRLHSCSCARIAYSYNIATIYTSRPHTAWPGRAYLCGERMGDFSACSSHEWAPRRVGFTDTSTRELPREFRHSSPFRHWFCERLAPSQIRNCRRKKKRVRRFFLTRPREYAFGNTLFLLGLLRALVLQTLFSLNWSLNLILL